MFSRLTTMLAEMTSQALAPAVEQHKGEEFKLHWKAVTTLLFNHQDDNSSVSETTLPAHLNSMVDILCYEEEQEKDRMGQSMEFLLQHKVMETLQTLSKTNCPVGIRDQALKFFTLLLSKLQQPLLPQVSVHKTLQRVIKSCGETGLDSTTAFSEVQLLRTICTRLESQPFMAEFFIEKSKSQVEFLIVDALLKLALHKDSLVVVKSYECLLQCAALKDSSVAKTIAEHSELPHKLVTNLCSHFSSILPSTSPTVILSSTSSWSTNCELVGGVGLSSAEHVQAFLCWMDYCNQLTSTCQSELAVALCQALEKHLLEQSVKPRLLEGSEEDLLMLTALMVRLLQITSSSQVLQQYVVKFLVGDDDKHDLRHRLVQNCDHINDEISLATLHLFDIILSLPISLSHLLTVTCTDSTTRSHTHRVNGREHLQNTVESFLSIVPTDLCSAVYEETDHLGYNEYLLEARSQVAQMQLHNSAPPTQQMKDSATPNQQYLSKFAIAMFLKLERMLDQSLDLNLMLTSLLTKVLVLLPAHLETAIVKGSHINHEKPSPSSNPNLYNILNKVSQDLQSRVAHSPTLPVNIAEARKRLQGRDVSDLLSMPHNDLVEGAVILEEFCKEVACLLFMKWTNSSMRSIQ